MNTKFATRQIRTIDIIVYPRLRKKPEQIGELAQDIREHGLLNPITVMDRGDGSYALIAGLRRLKATERLMQLQIRATVLSPIDAEKALALEFAENEQRQDFTVSERLEYAARIKAIEQEKAKERMRCFARQGHGEDLETPQGMDLGPYPEKGPSRDFIAHRTGFNSGRQYDRAMTVAEKRPDLLEKIDNGETTITSAYKQAVNLQEKSKAACDKLPDRGSSLPESTDRVARAKHERLMKNALYAELFHKHKEAVQEANRAKGDLRFQVEGFQKVIRGHEENVRAMIRQTDQLEAENRELRRRLGLSEDEPIDVTTTTENEEDNPT